MLIIGAGGHAKEIVGILGELGQTDHISFYDDTLTEAPLLLLNKFNILKTEQEAKAAFQSDPRFILGVGKPSARHFLAEKMSALGGQLTSVISPFARIGYFDVALGAGLNVMTGAVITQDVTIGKGCLIHVNATVHHDCRIGEFCEISPGSHILGKVSIGNFTSVGSGAVILPGRKVGNYVIIGAGAVVTKDLADGVKVKGIPAR